MALLSKFLVILIAILICVLGGQIYAKLAPDSSDGSTYKQISQDNASRIAQNQIASRNTARKNDVSRALAAAQEYTNNNVGTLPTGFVDGMLRGTDPNETPSTIELGYYTTMEVNFGRQPVARGDSLVLVTGAICGQNGETIDGSSRSIAVQYGSETPTGTFSGICVNE